MRALWAGLAVLIGCAGEPAKAPAKPAVKPAAAADERDALWALAPAGARVGVVVSPHGLAMLEHGALALQELLASSPDFAADNARLMRELLNTVGTTNPTLAGLGFGRDRGLAVFVGPGEHVTQVLPVADRDKFLNATHGTKGADGDVIGSTFCKPLDGRYVCVVRREVLATMARRSLDAIRARDPARGDVELAIQDQGVGIVAAVELERGAAIMRGSVRGAPPVFADLLGAPVQPRAGAEAAAGFGVMNLAPLLAKWPPVPLVAGVTLADVARTVAGPMTFVVGAGTGDAGIRIPLRDAAAIKAVIEHCPVVLRRLAIRGEVHDGGCRVGAPGGLVLEAWIDGSELRIGNRAAAPATTLVATRLSRDLAHGAWSAALFGRGVVSDLRQLLGSAVMRVPGFESAMRLAPVTNELGVGLRRDGEAVRFVAGVRTIWSNPDDVVQKVMAISPADVASGKAVEITRTAAAAAPRSPLAQDVQAGMAGMIALVAPFGLVTGVQRAMAGPSAAIAMPATIHMVGGARKPARFPLVAARAAIKRTTIFSQPTPAPAPEPPGDVFVRTHYRSGPGQLVAYETPTRPGARRPAILWIHGGFTWGIGDDLWQPAPRNNDQTAAALRIDGLVVMVPALRGASGNPGKPECFLGEVDDILAAAAHLAQRPDVDPQRIYLAGHSTGGTLALLAAASTDRFRAVFAFGPMADPREYGDNGCEPDGKTAPEYIARAPVAWIDAIVTPTLVIEGQYGNVGAFPSLRRRASPAVQFFAVPEADHFSALAPASEAIARAIIADTGPTLDITLDTAAIAREAAELSEANLKAP
jgi:acetyl esterase/lipase